MHFKVLVVEDEERICRMLESAFEGNRHGLTFELVFTDRVSAATGILKANGIALVLLDKGVKDSEGLDGFKVLHEQFPSVPIFIGTGDTNIDKAARAIKAGATDYMFKPFDINSLHLRFAVAIWKAQYITELEKRAVAVPPRNIPWVPIIIGVLTVLAALFGLVTQMMKK